MGIHSLAKLIAEQCPNAIKEFDIKHLFGRKIAIDASMFIYQFLIAVRQDGQNLMNEKGEVTSHLNGLFYRTIRMLENGIKPLYVFDGKPPDLKSHELDKRAQRRDEAEQLKQTAIDEGDKEAVDKYTRRLVKVTSEHNEECKTLLKLMGVPYVDAPCEAEAQCASLVKDGVVYATGTEDMDALTFGSTIMLRNLNFSDSKKVPIREYSLDKILSGMELNSQDEFIDLCILMGCDYCDTIRGIGPKRSLELIKNHKSIEKIINKLDRKKYTIPENWCFKEAKEMFKNPEVYKATDLEIKWTVPDEEGLIKFMVEDKGFGLDRIQKGLKKIESSKEKTSQTRIDGFFASVPREIPKRKVEDKKERKSNTGKKRKSLK
ncbi:hypothetical protein ACOME3_001161 [Neoechinorhynchus agilis]